MLKQRLITGALLIASLVGLLWLDDRVSGALEREGVQLPAWLGGTEGLILALATVLVVAPVLAVELAALLRGSGIPAPTWLTVVAATAGAALMRLLPHASSTQQAAAVTGSVGFALLLVALVVHARGRQVQGVVAATGGTLFSFIYVGMLLGVWLLIRDTSSVWVLAGAMLTIKASDTGAYFTGMAIGRHKLIPWLSPGKTWEGIVGGIALASLVGALLAMASGSLADQRDHVSVPLGALGGALLGIISPIGDLAESLLKRSAGAKDSGTLLPGMGGALDVLDSPLLAGPVVYWLLHSRSL